MIPNNHLQLFRSMLQRELRIYIRTRSEIASVFIVYFNIVLIVPMLSSAVISEQQWLAPCIIWMATVIASILSQEQLFRTDFNCGILEQVIVNRVPLFFPCFAKFLAHWLVIDLPLILSTPLLALLFDLPRSATLTIALSLLLGGPALSLLGAIVAAITVSLKNGAVLLMLLLLPLYVPIVVLGASTGILNLLGMPYNAQMALLGALSLLCLMFAPFATSAALRINLT